MPCVLLLDSVLSQKVLFLWTVAIVLLLKLHFFVGMHAGIVQWFPGEVSKNKDVILESELLLQARLPHKMMCAAQCSAVGDTHPKVSCAAAVSMLWCLSGLFSLSTHTDFLHRHKS